MITNLQNLLI